MSKGMRNTFFIDESRIRNFSTETIDASNARSHLFNYMTDKNSIKEFQKMSDKVPLEILEMKFQCITTILLGLQIKNSTQKVIRDYIHEMYNLKQLYNHYLGIDRIYISFSQLFRSSKVLS